jgi:hypothetical protein
MGLLTLRYAEQYDLAMRLLEVALDGARREGHAPGRASSTVSGP